MPGNTFHRVHGLSVRRTVLKNNCRRRRIKVTLKFGRIVGGTVVVDSERGVTVRPDHAKLRTKERADEAAVLNEDPDKLGASVISHGRLP